MQASILSISYLIASVTFILGLKMLSHPESARRGNIIAAVGMSIAIFATIFLYQPTPGVYLGNKLWMFAALAIGTVAGFFAAKKVKMTAMPEMVSLFNGMGGACAMLISIIEFNGLLDKTYQPPFATPMGNVYVFSEHVSRGEILVIVIGLIIGSVSFAGSIIAWGKLNGKIKDRVFKQQRIINFSLLALIFIAAAIFIYMTPGTLEHLKLLLKLKGGSGAADVDYNNLFTITSNGGYHSDSGLIDLHFWFFYVLFGLAILYGVLFVMPIGGADMPVVISLLNSFTGVAAACGGFLYDNSAMLTGGILVGAAGTLLTIMMCKAMNRSLLNVILGAFGGGAKTTEVGSKEQGAYKEISLSDSAMVMNYASKVMIVPGYGLAVAQAQHICHELEKILTEKGVEVIYAIHPVAGRMPGHMNVLLAEADVSYDKLMEMEQANDEFKTADVVLILGANDVVNPAAKSDPSSPIYGMPILEVEQAKAVIVNKRSMKPGYAGIENDLFFQPKTSMLFGDAKKVLQDLVSEIKSV